MADCPGCKKPMIDGQAFNGLLKCHWDCQDIVKANMGSRNSDDLMKYRARDRLAQDGIYPGHPLFDKLIGTLDETI